MPRFASGSPICPSADGDAIVPGHRDLEPTAQRGAVHRHHDRLGQILDPLQEIVQFGCAGITAPGDVLEAFDVGPRREGPAGANHDHGPHRRVASHRVNRGADAVDDLLAECVDRRIVDADERDAIRVRDADCGIHALHHHILLRACRAAGIRSLQE